MKFRPCTEVDKRELRRREGGEARVGVAPLSVSAMQAALVIIFIGALADFSFQTTVGPTNVQSLAQLMVFFKGRGDWHSAAVVGVSLMALALIGSTVLAVAARFIMRGRVK